MLFNSFSFAVFFPVVVIFYFLLPAKYRVPFLLLASCIFYMAFVPQYILILFALITLDFFLGQLIAKEEGRRRVALLWVSIAANLGMLFFFKYFNFFNQNVDALADFLHWNYDPLLLAIALPLGLSFHIFQSLSYVIEVYRGRYMPERNYFVYALYVMFFPQLVAGPIERPANLLPQLHAVHSFDAGRARRGLERMLWGFFKKMVIADNIGVIVNDLWTTLPSDGPTLIILATLFAFQMYCDFSGYADIAIGSAKMLGFDLMENFNRPFASRSVAEFWRRWHISLSSWLRDYLYYPLAFSGKRITPLRLHLSTVVTFVLIGLWHGANWTYVIMGGLYGVYIVGGTITEKWRLYLANISMLTRVPAAHHALQIFVTFSLVSFSLIFFRAENIQQAWYFISHLGNDLGNFEPLRIWFEALQLPDKMRFAIFLSGIVLMECVQYFQARSATFYVFDTYPRLFRYGWYYLLIIAILVFGYFKAQTFIYFQF